jgi:hypothetical protein
MSGWVSGWLGGFKEWVDGWMGGFKEWVGGWMGGWVGFINIYVMYNTAVGKGVV